MIERSPIEYKYNGLVNSIINQNKYMEYNEVENKYYLNEVAYKTIMFERKYREYVQQLPVLVKGMMSYGYRYNSFELGEFKESVGEDFIVKDDIKNLLTQAKRSEQVRSTVAIDELLDLLTEDRLYIYKSVLKGEYDVRKGNDWGENELTKTMTVKNIEVFEKVIPLFVSMVKMYNIDDIKEIFTSCINSSGFYNFAAIRRIKNLANILYNSKLDRIDVPIKQYIEDVYKFVSDNETIDKGTLNKFIQDHAIQYADSDSYGDIVIRNSPKTMETIATKLTDIFKCLINISKPNRQKKVTLTIVELPWVDKETKERNFLTNIGSLDFFLDNIEVKVEDINMSDINF